MKMKQIFWIALLLAGTTGIGVAQQTKSVEIPGDVWTAYNIPEGGSALQLNINRAGTNLAIDDSEIQLQDTSDTVQWYRSSANQATHVYQIGTVLSAREYLHVFGHWHYLGGTGGGGTPPTFNAKVAAPDVDLESLTEEQEESLGLWIAKSGARKPLTVKVVQCKGANNQQTLTWSSAKISLWTAAAGGSMFSGGSQTLAADQNTTYYAQGDNASGSIRDTEIKTAYTVSGNTASDKVKLTVVGASISSFATVLVNATNDVSVTLSPNPPGITGVLQIACLSGSGSAAFIPGGSTSSNIAQSTTVKIKGLTASSVTNNMILKALLNSDVLASNVFTVIEPTVELTVQKSLLTLKHDKNCNVQINVQPPGVSVTDYRIEMKQASGSTWYTLTNAQSLTPWSAKVAGNFHLRGMAKAGGIEYFSSNVAVTVQFPSYSQIVGDTAVQTATDTQWTNTKNDCTEDPNRRHELGFWVSLNTANDTYTAGSTVTGPWVGPDEGAYIDNMGDRPADNPSSPAPNSTGATYSVTFFHTHTPTTYRTVGRQVGPTPDDDNFHTNQDVTGIVFDYIAVTNGNMIPAGHPKDSSAQRYQSGPTRRSTP